MCAKKIMPFEYQNGQDFKNKLSEWVGDILYEKLPELGYEERDEQIFTAFQIADAFCDQKVHFAEAGLGTGKTFAYLLSAIPYARYTRKPVVIACATSALQEQLASETGDIATISKLLNLEVDARMAKDASQYVCDVRVSENVDDFGEQTDEINEWIQTTKRGERSEIPNISDIHWNKINWNEFVACDTCQSRGFCKLVQARKFYRAAEDLIIVDHETFFKDLWTREERIANGKLPILPSYSAVVFDEGHKVLLPAAMAAGHRVSQIEIRDMIENLEEIQDARPSLVKTTLLVKKMFFGFYKLLKESISFSESSDRLAINTSDALFLAADHLRKALDQLLMEMQIEQELYIESLTPTQMQAFEGQIERSTMALARFLQRNEKETIYWVDRKDGSFWVVPRNIANMIDKELYQKKLPVIFTSATLSNDGNFDYFARTVGVKNPSKSTIGSTFDLEKQAIIYLAQPPEEKAFVYKAKCLVSLLKQNGGRALVLTNSLREVQRIRKAISQIEFPFEMLWEDKADRGYIVQKFREDETSVLIGNDFWEGIDVPGEALTMVVIWQLPFPELDPLIEVSRKEAKAQGLDPVIEVDYPEMGLKMKQGCGRLIRTRMDHGKIVVLDSIIGKPWESIARAALPDGVKIKRIK